MQKALDRDKRERVLAVLGMGGSRSLAAEFVGCHPKTIRNTAQSDPSFAEKLRHAESSPEVHFLATIAQAGKGTVHAAKWALERLYPDTYGRRKPGSYSVEDIKQLFTELANRLADAAANEQERDRALSTMADFGKELLLANAPFVDQAIPLRAEIDALRAYLHQESEDSDLGQTTFTYDTLSIQCHPRFAPASNPEPCPAELLAESTTDTSDLSDSQSSLENNELPDAVQTIRYESARPTPPDSASSTEPVEPPDPPLEKEHNHAA